MKPVKTKQLYYRLIFTFSLVKLESLKIYIKFHTKTTFIQLLKYFANTSILFLKETESTFYIYFDWPELHHLAFTNW